MTDKPLEILPWGRSLEDVERLERKKAAGRRGGFGCLLYGVAFALLCVFAWGWSVGHTGSTCKPIGNESALSPSHRTTEQRK